MTSAIDHALLYALMLFFKACYATVIVSAFIMIVLIIAWTVSVLKYRMR